MPDPSDEALIKEFAKKTGELGAAEALKKDIEKVLKIASFRRGVYQRGMEAVKLDEKIRNIDWWRRAVKIGAAAGIGLAFGAWAFTPAVMSYLSTTGAAAWASTTTGLSTTTVTWLAVRGGTFAVGGLAQTLVSGSDTAPGRSIATLLFLEGYKDKYERLLSQERFDVLGLADLRFVRGIVADDFQFIMDVETACRRCAHENPDIPRSIAENAKTRFCLEFWAALEGKLLEILRTGKLDREIVQLTAEVNQLKARVEAAAARK